MTREEIAIELTKLYVTSNRVCNSNETRYTTIYRIMLDNIEKEEKSDAQLEIEQVGYEEFYRYYKEKEAAIEQLQLENNLLKHRLDVADAYIEERKENMIIEHYNDLKYIINECDSDSTW